MWSSYGAQHNTCLVDVISGLHLCALSPNVAPLKSTGRVRGRGAPPESTSRQYPGNVYAAFHSQNAVLLGCANTGAIRALRNRRRDCCTKLTQGSPTPSMHERTAKYSWSVQIPSNDSVLLVKCPAFLKSRETRRCSAGSGKQQGGGETAKKRKSTQLRARHAEHPEC